MVYQSIKCLSSFEARNGGARNGEGTKARNEKTSDYKGVGSLCLRLRPDKRLMAPVVNIGPVPFFVRFSFQRRVSTLVLRRPGRPRGLVDRGGSGRPLRGVDRVGPSRRVRRQPDRVGGRGQLNPPDNHLAEHGRLEPSQAAKVRRTRCAGRATAAPPSPRRAHGKGGRRSKGSSPDSHRRGKVVSPFYVKKIPLAFDTRMGRS